MPDSLKKILYVEDEPDIAYIARLALETIGGFEVFVCENGGKAVREGPGYGPDLIMLDVMMPEMDGPATLKELRKNPLLARTPVVFMTAKVQPAEISIYKELGAIDVIPKPFDPMTLAERVRAIWSQRTG